MQDKTNSAENSSLADQYPNGDFYQPWKLRNYDFWVHRLNNHLFWKCPTKRLIQQYDDHISGNHLEIGLGTGYLLDTCKFPIENPRLVLCDISRNCLNRSAKRLARYHPTPVERDVLYPLTGLGPCFDSVGLNYVLHCMPGDLKSKSIAFAHIADVLSSEGVLFGSTILTKGVKVSWQARMQIRQLQRLGAFCNSEDSLSDLDAALNAAFANHCLQVQGCVALFYAKSPHRASALTSDSTTETKTPRC